MAGAGLFVYWESKTAKLMGIDWLKHQFNPRWHNCVVCRPLHPNALRCSITDTYSLVHRYELMAYQTPAMNSLIHTQYPPLTGQSGDAEEERERRRKRESDQHLCFVTCVAHCWGAVSFGCKWLCHIDLISKQKEVKIEAIEWTCDAARLICKLPACLGSKDRPELSACQDANSCWPS